MKIESQYLTEGAVVSFKGQRSSATIQRVSVIELHAMGFVGQQKDLKDSPLRLFFWHEIDDFMFVGNQRPEGIKRTSGGKA